MFEKEGLRAGITHATHDAAAKGLHLVQTLGGTQQLGVINESGLIALVLRCREPGTRKSRPAGSVKD